MKRIDSDKLKRAVALYTGGKSISEVVALSGIGKSSIYRELARLGIPRHKKSSSKED